MLGCTGQGQMISKSKCHPRAGGGPRKIKTWMPAFAGMTIFVFLLISFPAHAASCYTQEGYEAEQGLRLHSDMEVVMLTCKYDGFKQPLSSHYKKFMGKYSRNIKGWEDVIARVFADTGRSRAEVIDNFRTYLANRRSHEAASIGIRNFCVKYANLLITIGNYSPQQLVAHVRQQDFEFPPKLPPCGR